MDKHTASDILGALITIASTAFAGYWLLAL
jgi:hypothetical protein